MEKINFYFEDTTTIDLKKNQLRNQIRYLAKNELKQCGEMCIIFCSDEYLLEMNRKYLSHHDYTDIITFDYSEKQVVRGDLFISTDRVKENAEKFGTGFMKELYRVVFHGVLHLVGYKDNRKRNKN